MNSAWGKNSDRSLKLPLKTGVLGVCAPNGGRQWRNPLRCDYLVLVRSPEPKMVRFRDLVGSAYVPVSKNVAVKKGVFFAKKQIKPRSNLKRLYNKHCFVMQKDNFSSFISTKEKYIVKVSAVKILSDELENVLHSFQNINDWKKSKKNLCFLRGKFFILEVGLFKSKNMS